MRGHDRGVHNESGGTGHGPTVQSGTIQGGVHFHSGTRPDRPVTPWQLPPVGRITDRREALAALERWRDRAVGEGLPALAAVTGLGGVGKSVLALSWLHTLRPRFPDGQLYADLGAPAASGPVAPVEVLSGFLSALGVPAQRMPTAVGERTALYRSLTSGGRLVVLLDDAATAAQVRPLLPSGGNLTVVTSRWRMPGLALDGCYPVHLEPLDDDAAIELLAATLADDRVADQPTEARALVSLCAGLPLAVRVAGARLASRPQRPITTMVRALSEERRRLEELAIEGDHTVRAALDLAYQSLPPTARRLYRLLGLHPGPDFGGPVVTAVLADIAEPQATERPGPLLELLQDANLLTESGEERYRFHDLVRLHAAARAETDEAPEARRAALRRVFDHYLASATRAEELLDPHHRSLPRDFDPATAIVAEDITEDTALDWLDRERANLMAVIRQARQLGFPAVTWQLADAIWPLFTRRKRYEDWHAAHSEGVAAAQEGGNTAAECRMLTSGGLGELDTGGQARALEMFERAARLFQRSGDALGAARTLNYRGLAHQGLGQLIHAAHLFERAAEALPRVGDERAGALARLNLAGVALAWGRYEDAAADAAAALETLRAPDPYNAARASAVLGRAELGRGRLDAAERHLTGALETLRGMAADFEVARTVEAVAQLAGARGQPELARTRFREAHALYTALGLPDAAAALRDRLE